MGFHGGRGGWPGITGGGSSDEISFISTNSRSNIFLDTFAGRSAMGLKGPIAWSPLWEFPIRLSAVPWLDVASRALAATSARKLRGVCWLPASVPSPNTRNKAGSCGALVRVPRGGQQREQ